MNLIPISGAICLLASVILGWVLAIHRYTGRPLIKKIFPGYRYLVRSHVDFSIMAALLFGGFACLKTSGISMSYFSTLALTVGAVYNPAGLMVQAIKPELTRSPSPVFQKLIFTGFIPATMGFVSLSIEIIFHFLKV